MEVIRQGQTGMFTTMDNSAALSQFAQIVPDNRGLVLAAQDTSSSSDEFNLMILGAGLVALFVAGIIIYMLRSKRRRHTR